MRSRSSYSTAATVTAWAELDGLVRRAGPRLDRLPPDEILRLAALYRAAAADLATARRRTPSDPLVAQLEQLVRRARQLVYGTADRRDTLRRFVTRGFWRRVAERPAFLAVAAVLLLGPMLALGLWAHGDPVAGGRAAAISPFGTADDGGDDGDDRSDVARDFGLAESADLSGQIFANNARLALIAFAGGITGGLLTAAGLVFNGIVIGLLGGLSVAAGSGDRFFRLVVPHGALELSLIVVAGAAGLRVGWALVHPGHRRRAEALTSEARAAAEMALGAAALLVPCGLVEGFVTPLGLSLPVAVALGTALAGAFWASVLWLGRDQSRARALRPR
jgi:uncharacterized membrane protein SpoIIM required for sporulation